MTHEAFMHPITDTYRNLIRELAGFIPPARLLTDELCRLAHGTDASFYRLVPQLVVRVESETDVQQVLHSCARRGLPVTFRAAGTSLSGQAVTDSVLIQLGNGWNGHQLLNDGAAIRLQPGVIGARANSILAPLQRKIGPDPASINACMIGGIAANNASGMCCGTAQNSYNTLLDLRLIFADGTLLDTADPASVSAFRNSHSDLLEQLPQPSPPAAASAPVLPRSPPGRSHRPGPRRRPQHRPPRPADPAASPRQPTPRHPAAGRPHSQQIAAKKHHQTKEPTCQLQPRP